VKLISNRSSKSFLFMIPIETHKTQTKSKTPKAQTPKKVVEEAELEEPKYVDKELRNEDKVHKIEIPEDYLEDEEYDYDDEYGSPPLSVTITEAQLPSARNEGGEYKEIYDALHQYFLSPKAATEKEDQDNEQVPTMEPDQIAKLLQDNVEGLHSMMDRTGSMPVVHYIVSTYHTGLPLFEGNMGVQQHTIKAIRYILHKSAGLPEKIRKSSLRRLAEAYTACQMEQGRVIDSLYGSLSGRDKSFKEQILSLVDIQKEQVLNQIVNRFNPNAWKTGDDNPRGQVPHIQSTYCAEIGTKLGLRGTKAAKLDQNKCQLDPTSVMHLEESFRRLFLIGELINTLIADVNQQDPNAERLINRQSLTQWAGDQSQNNNFHGHAIFFDEEKASEWNGKPTVENQYQPFLNHKVALSILEHLFLK
jgi:hypothetical protein